ncbi:MAG: Kelch repeat-containing protein [Chloroflexota bacterium]
MPTFTPESTISDGVMPHPLAERDVYDVADQSNSNSGANLMSRIPDTIRQTSLLMRRTVVSSLTALALLTLTAHSIWAQAEGGLPEVDGWRVLAPLLAPVSEQAVVELGGNIYVIGGYPPGRVPVSNVQIYDVASNRWQFGPALPVPMHHAVAAVANGRVYVLGGEFDGAGTGRAEVYLDTVYALDPDAGIWEQRASMPTGRSAGGAAVIDDKIYVAGGRPPRGSDFAVYDTRSDSWQVLPELPTQRNHLAVGALNGQVIVAGGRFGGGFNSERTATLEIFDPATGAWSAGPALPSPRGGVAGVSANGCLFVIGGEGNYADPRGLNDETEAFDPRSQTWHSFAPMPTPTHGLVGAAFVNGQIHIPGGSVTIGGGTGSVIHQVYRPRGACSEP